MSEVASIETIPQPFSASTPWNAWNLSPPIEVCSLEEVMNEEMAKSLQEKENKLNKYKKTNQNSDDNFEACCLTDPELDPGCDNDLLLAQLMQAEFDLEHDDILKREEKKFNGTNKVTVSFKNYRKIPENLIEDDSSQSYLEEPKHWDSFESRQSSSQTIGKSGFARCGNTITTKHDANICGSRNARRVMEFPPGIQTGDGGGFDMKLPNKVYNTLKVHSKNEEKRNKRIHDKIEKATAMEVLDPQTRLLIYKLVNAEILEEINGCISTGKEAAVFHAVGGKSNSTEMPIPSECAVKVFKTTLNEFRTRDKYIQDDYRFKDRFSKQNVRKIIKLWAEKEKQNLIRMRKYGIPCPEVVILKKHVLVMSFIGTNLIPAPQLKEAKLPLEQVQKAYLQTVEIMKTMYNACKLVHADLSEYNLLWHNNQVWFIDVSQAVDIGHPHALEFLMRDCNNISLFFSKQGVPNVANAKSLFTDVCGLDLPGESTELLIRIQQYEKNQELLAHGKTQNPFPFDSVFDLTRQKSPRSKKHPVCTRDVSESKSD